MSSSVDTRALEHHLEAIRKKHEESRDPVVGQLRSMVDVMKRKDDAFEPMYRQLSTIVPTLQSSVAQMQASQQKMEENLKQSLKRCVLSFLLFVDCVSNFIPERV